MAFFRGCVNRFLPGYPGAIFPVIRLTRVVNIFFTFFRVKRLICQAICVDGFIRAVKYCVFKGFFGRNWEVLYACVGDFEWQNENKMILNLILLWFYCLNHRLVQIKSILEHLKSKKLNITIFFCISIFFRKIGRVNWSRETDDEP